MYTFVNNLLVVQNLKMALKKANMVGVAMGSLLGPALANIFVGFHEERLFDCDQKPGVYFRYVDDTYTIFKTEAECDTFLKRLNSLHTALHFTFEKEVK